MPDHVYRIIEVAGSSQKSIEDALQNAVVIVQARWIRPSCQLAT
jgi:flavin-binding protein dodecin